MNTCYIFGAMDIGCKLPCFDESDIIIAADLGFKNLQKLNINPHITVGDFDSLNYIPKGENILVHPSEKDETDTLLAIDLGFEKGFKSFYLYGCLGGRLDHTFANIQLARYIVEKGGTVFIKDNSITLTVIKNNIIKFTNRSKGIFSVFSLSDISKGVTIKGAKYQANNIDLSADYPLGISNEFIEKDSIISVKNGILCIIFENGNSYKIN